LIKLLPKQHKERVGADHNHRKKQVLSAIIQNCSVFEQQLILKFAFLQHYLRSKREEGIISLATGAYLSRHTRYSPRNSKTPLDEEDP